MKKEIKNIISLALSLIIVNVSLGTSVQGAEISNYSMHNNNIGTAVIENSKDDKAGIQYDYEDIVWSRYKIAAKPYGNRESVFDNTTDDSVRYQDDFYGAMNNAWLKEADSYLSDDLQEISYYSYLQLKSANDINNIFKDLLHNSSKYNSNTTEGKMINLYCNLLNYDERNKQGSDGAKKYTDKVKAVKNMDGLTELLSTEEMDIFNNLFRFKIMPSANKKVNELYIQPTLLGLVNSDDYLNYSEESIKNKNQYEKYVKNLLILYGYSEDEAEKKVNDLIQFETGIAESMVGLGDLQQGDIDYNSINMSLDIKELNEIAPNLRLPEILKGLGLDKSGSRITLQQKKWIVALNDLYTEDNLPAIKNYIEITILEALGEYLDKDFEKLTDNYIEYLQNSTDNSTKQEKAYNTVYDNFSDEFGKLYAEKYCSEDEKKDIELLAKELINKYREKLEKCTWISEATRNNAIKKLDNMKINIGYPGEYDDYSEIEVKSFAEGGSLVENMMNISVYQKHKEFQSLYEPLNNVIFSDTVKPSSVIAEYHFDSNSLVVTAGMMQPDFYNINDSKEKKLATIGYVLGHEISHAFDDMGALYDYEGNYYNWWSASDYEKFSEKAEKFKNYFNSIEYLPGKYLNGQATLGENIADYNSLSCVLDIMGDLENADYKEFFENYAEGFKCARKSDYEEMMLQWDTHSPYKCRVNNVLAQFEKFYEIYDIKSDDGMYIKPEDRLSMW